MYWYDPLGRPMGGDDSQKILPNPEQPGVDTSSPVRIGVSAVPLCGSSRSLTA
jgi:hypothetical protein